MSTVLKTRSGRTVKLPTPEENVTINAGIAADPDSPELDDQWFAGAKPAAKVLDSKLYASLVAMKRPPGRPRVEQPKVFTGIRLDAEVVASFKASGKGWQTRVNEALKDWLRTHSPI